MLDQPQNIETLLHGFTILFSAMTKINRTDLLQEIGNAPGDFKTILRTAGFAAWPQWITEHWPHQMQPNTIYSDWAATNHNTLQLQTQLVNQIKQHLEHSQINHCFLKGHYSRKQLYPDPLLRPSNDIDIAIQTKDATAVIDILEQLDFDIQNRALPRFNFEWTLVHQSGCVLDLHADLGPAWRIPWNGIAGLFSDDIQRVKKTHALHALLHFAHHKGFVRAIQELDVWLYDKAGFYNSVPQPLSGALALWQQRKLQFWEKADSKTKKVKFYDAAEWNPIPNCAWFRHKAIGFQTSTRKIGWIGQAIGVKI